jgi:hypothetical protein
MNKKTYIIAVTLYFIVNLLFFFKADISYYLAGVRPEIVEFRDLTHEEYKNLKGSYITRLFITNLLLYGSILTFIIQFIIRKFYPIKFDLTSNKRYFNIINRLIIIICIFWIIVLSIAKTIHFIPSSGMIG